jgi:hypothetical protein
MTRLNTITAFTDQSVYADVREPRACVGRLAAIEHREDEAVRRAESALRWQRHAELTALKSVRLTDLCCMLEKSTMFRIGQGKIPSLGSLAPEILKKLETDGV